MPPSQYQGITGNRKDNLVLSKQIGSLCSPYQERGKGFTYGGRDEIDRNITNPTDRLNK
jgi:hypothetical protein